jgi:hypothetical protein
VARSKPILCVDFDGVIHSYERGWQDGVIYGTVVPGFFRWAIATVEKFELVVYSNRSKTEEGRSAMAQWLGTQSIEAIHSGEVPADYDWARLFGRLQFVHEKPPAWLTIDDRAICFKGDWNALELSLEAIETFKPWMTQGR